MNIYFAKTILYSYSVLDDVISQIDDLVEKKAISSMTDNSPAIYQCEKICELSSQKAILIILKDIVERILKDFTSDELLHLDYKYFKKKDKSEYAFFDYSSRAYFRRQLKIFTKFNKKLEKMNIDDEWFKKNCLSVDFFKSLLRTVIEKEEFSYKNKKQIDKTRQREIAIKVKETYSKITA